MTRKRYRFRTVTLLVLPAEAVILAQAQAQGSLYLTLRHPEDLSVVTPPPAASPKSIMNARLKKLREQRHKTIQRIRTIRGLPGLRRP